MKILLQTLIPKDLERNEIKHINTNLENTKKVFEDVKLQVASVSDHKEFEITKFSRLDSTKFKKMQPEAQPMERRFEINSGKRILIEYAKQSSADYVVFFDSDQSMPEESDWKATKQFLEETPLCKCLHIPVIMRPDPTRNIPPHISINTESLNFYIVKPEVLRNIDLFTITRMWQAYEGSVTPYAPDNTLCKTIKRNGTEVYVVKPVKTLHEDEKAVYEYNNGKIKITKK